MMLQLMAVIGMPLALCFIIVFMPFIGKHDDEYKNDVSIDEVDVDIKQLAKLLDKKAAERQTKRTRSRFKYTLAGYKEG